MIFWILKVSKPTLWYTKKKFKRRSLILFNLAIFLFLLLCYPCFGSISKEFEPEKGKVSIKSLLNPEGENVNNGLRGLTKKKSSPNFKPSKRIAKAGKRDKPKRLLRRKFASVQGPKGVKPLHDSTNQSRNPIWKDLHPREKYNPRTLSIELEKEKRKPFKKRRIQKKSQNFPNYSPGLTEKIPLFNPKRVAPLLQVNISYIDCSQFFKFSSFNSFNPSNPPLESQDDPHFTENPSCYKQKPSPSFNPHEKVQPPPRKKRISSFDEMGKKSKKIMAWFGLVTKKVFEKEYRPKSIPYPLLNFEWNQRLSARLIKALLEGETIRGINEKFFKNCVSNNTICQFLNPLRNSLKLPNPQAQRALFNIAFHSANKEFEIFEIIQKNKKYLGTVNKLIEELERDKITERNLNFSSFSRTKS